jgi:subtilase family serine protease
MLLLLEPSAAQQAELDALVAAQQNPASPLYRHWLTPAQYGARFGASAHDLSRVVAWLAAHGFTVEEIPPGNRLVVFSGTAGQISDTFHTQIHRYRIGGIAHIANAQDPQIPAALSGVVAGVVSLHNFRRTSEIKSRTALFAAVARVVIGPRAGFQPLYSAGSTHYLFPADFAAIYDLNPLYSAGTAGAGITIAIAGRSNINLSDAAAFRSISGLAPNPPSVILPGADPGLVAGDQDESTMDVEWSGAVAPNAAVSLVAAPSTATTDGIDLAAQYIVNHRTAPVVSVSYGSCEQDMGATELAFYNSLWEQAASQGMSAFVASGDAGAADCSTASDTTGTQTAVNGLCSSPYSTCVGGTEFNEGSNSAEYWSSANSAGYGSALGYIPEEVWNESGSNSGTGLWASGGGASVVYPQPAWQAGITGASAANGMRAVPDVALSTADHDGYFIYENGSFWIISGTSAASPSFAGMMALVVEKMGGAGQGSANAPLYLLANAERNPFHPTPSGNNSVPGVPGFSASGAAYNLATGLGSVDGAVLAASWGSGNASGADFALSASAAGAAVLTGQSASFTLTATEAGSAAGAVQLAASAPAGVEVTFSSSAIQPGIPATVTITAGPAAAIGTQNISIAGSNASGTETLTYALTVVDPPTLTLTAAASQVVLDQGSSATLSFTAVTGGTFTGNIALSAGSLPSGLTAVWSANPLAPSSSVNTVTLTLTASALATQGSFTILLTASGDGLVATQSVTVQVQQPRVCFGLMGPMRLPCGSPMPVRSLAPHPAPF